MAKKKEEGLVFSPKDVSFQDTSILEFYVADAIKDRLEDFLSNTKTLLKKADGQKEFSDGEGKLNYTVKDADGLSLKVSTSAGRKVFSAEKAEELIRKKNGDDFFDKNCVNFGIKKRPGAQIPKSILAELEKYFIITKEKNVDEASLWNYNLSKEDIESCYTEGTKILKVAKGSKIPDSMLVQMYKERNLDLITGILSGE